ncbi:TetR/AcrR family transcriptional regulator [Pseudonocardia humida]|uniref:TetR/AcrR family transcriptional regulator n=1 Tax=Pseudonocardia humida TaxID=2800819 RepID=UPI00207D23D5|nr:TetR/AcrR family transcriptional regulator [Pseudonocardia humida]
MPAASGTPPGRPRRRGAALARAIHRAALDELALTGYAGLTMDAVAHRAGTGKAALYRRWPTKRDLVLDALRHCVAPEPPDPDPSAPVRDEVVAALAAVADTLAGRSGFPGLEVMAELLREPGLRDTFGERVLGPRLERMAGVLRRAAERSGAEPAAVTPLLVRTGPALVVESFLRRGAPPGPDELAEIVDTVLLPLLTRPSERGQTRSARS